MPNTPAPPAIASPRSRTPSPPASAAGHAVTELLRAWSAGEPHATDSLVRLVYEELRRQARLTLRREGEGHTLQPTALVHEAWLRLGGQHDAHWESRTQFFALAARMMRRVLVDHARARRALKRGGVVHVTVGVGPADHLAEAVEGTSLDAVDVIALDDALARLAVIDPQKARLVDVRYFAGLSIPEAAAALGVSPATIGREWAIARMWLRRELDV
jgi:RNA polymerase sigma-70 factor (ECF subfamily)